MQYIHQIGFSISVCLPFYRISGKDKTWHFKFSLLHLKLNLPPDEVKIHWVRCNKCKKKSTAAGGGEPAPPNDHSKYLTSNTPVMSHATNTDLYSFLPSAILVVHQSKIKWRDASYLLLIQVGQAVRKGRHKLKEKLERQQKHQVDITIIHSFTEKGIDKWRLLSSI